MKKAFPFILGGVVLLLLLVIMMTATGGKSQRRMDERITLRTNDRIPYGTRVARELLSPLFPNATLPFDRKYPGAWDSVDATERNQAVILIADYFDADRAEMQELASFVEKGNYVFIIARAASDDVTDFFGVTYTSSYLNNFNEGDSLKLSLEKQYFKSDSVFTYPGQKFEGSFASVTSAHTAVLGRNQKGQPDFIQLNKGRGSFFVHTAPLAFSNYFILHKNNSAYYQQAVSVLPKDLNTILWNEYYLEKLRNDDNKEPNWLGALLSYPSFKWGLLVAAATLLLFMLLGMRRKQRMIPPHDKPKNDSLDFVKTLGRLYYDRRDHTNLATKMTAYFLEHVRSVYKLPTHLLDDVFIQALHYKSGYPEPELRSIMDSIHMVRLQPAISEKQLSDFHKQLELFYQNT